MSSNTIRTTRRNIQISTIETDHTTSEGIQINTTKGRIIILLILMAIIHRNKVVKKS